MTQSSEHFQKLTPVYWDDHNIHDAQAFQSAAHAPQAELTFEGCKRARDYLLDGIGHVAAGNATEIRYGNGTQFNADLPDGSLVITDTEYLTKWTYDDPDRSRKRSRFEESEPAFYRPFSMFWLNNQDGTIKPQTKLGTESVTLADENTLCTYGRILDWGIVMTQDQERLIKPFSFSAIKLLSNGEVYAPSVKRGFARAVRMPLPIGNVEVHPRLTVGKLGYARDTLERVRSVDVVHLGAGSKEPRRRRVLQGFVLPKFGLGEA